MLGKRGINNKKLNDLIAVLHKISKIVYIFIIIISIYALVVLIKETKLITFFITILKVLIPLIIGIFIAWLFDPLVKWLQKKGMGRKFAAVFIYFLFLAFLYFILSAIIPLLSSQITDFVHVIPNVIESIKNWMEGIFTSLGHIQNIDSDALKNQIFTAIEKTSNGIAKNAPITLINFVQTLVSGIGIFLIGLVIGFFLLMSFDNTSNLINFVPNKIQSSTSRLITQINESLRSYIQGALLDATFVFIITSIGLYISGLKAPALFGFFCGLTNMIPYAGPYIGGIPAVIVGFSQSPTIGLFTLLTIVIIQAIEGNFIQPVIMSKTTKLHPVTIITGLLIFGHFFGIIGMLVSTPIIAVLKSIFAYYNEKYQLLKSNEIIDSNEELDK